MCRCPVFFFFFLAHNRHPTHTISHPITLHCRTSFSLSLRLHVGSFDGRVCWRRWPASSRLFKKKTAKWIKAANIARTQINETWNFGLLFFELINYGHFTRGLRRVKRLNFRPLDCLAMLIVSLSQCVRKYFNYFNSCIVTIQTN